MQAHAAHARPNGTANNAHAQANAPQPPWSWDWLEENYAVWAADRAEFLEYARKALDPNHAHMCADCGLFELGNMPSARNKFRWADMFDRAVREHPAVREFPYMRPYIKTQVTNEGNVQIRKCVNCAQVSSRSNADQRAKQKQVDKRKFMTVDRDPRSTRCAINAPPENQQDAPVSGFTPMVLAAPHEVTSRLSYLRPIVQYQQGRSPWAYAATAAPIVGMSLTTGFIGPLVQGNANQRAPLNPAQRGQLRMLQVLMSALNPALHSAFMTDGEAESFPTVPARDLPAFTDAMNRAVVPVTLDTTQPIATAFNHMVTMTFRPELMNNNPIMGIAHLHGTTQHICMYPELYTDPSGRQHVLSVENALFPYLFPCGCGMFAYVGGWDIIDYWKFRFAQQFLTPFTLNPTYTLLSFQLKMKHVLNKGCVKMQLHKNATDSYILTKEDVRHMSREIPSSVPGSAKQMKQYMSEAKAACTYLDQVPDFMCTLTCNEFRWPEMRIIAERVWDAMGRPANISKSDLWLKAAPEINRIFRARIELFRQKYLEKNSHLFGKVKYYIIKIEFQGRGSPHAHIAIWLDDPNGTTKERINREITATKPDSSRFPDLFSTSDPAKAQFFNTLRSLVNSTMIHDCNKHGGACKKDGVCMRGFPGIPCTNYYIHANSDRYEYPRCGEEDAWVINYHPGLQRKNN